MGVISINGLPGKGKTLLATHLALKHYKSQNKFLARLIRRLRRKPAIYNSVYSNYPICLDKRRKIYSNRITIYDLDNSYSFVSDSLIIIDEVQLYYDSDEYKNFPRKIANFNQAHRHFGIRDIIYISQHPSRIVKKLRNVIGEYYRIKLSCCIPILNIGFITARKTYEFEDYDQAFTKDKDLKKMKDIKGAIFFINFRKVYKSYDTCYLAPLNLDKPLSHLGNYKQLDLSDEDLDLLRYKLF